MSVRLQNTPDKKNSSCVTSHFPVDYDSLKWEETRLSDPGGSCQSHGNETQVYYIVERVRISTETDHAGSECPLRNISIAECPV